MKKNKIKPFGVWANIYSAGAAERIRFAQQVESWGYGALWIPDPLVSDPFVNLAAIAVETDNLHLATGIANIQTRSPIAMAAARHSLSEFCGGRLILGLGVSHKEVISGMIHMDYSKPLTTMRNYLEQMNTPLPLMVAAPDGKPDLGLVVLAALGDKMLKLSTSHADGAHPYLITPEHTARAREIMGPDAFLAPEQKVLYVKDPATARAAARQYIALYLGLQNYRKNLLTLGFTEEDFENGGSDRLVDSLVVWGDESKILKGLEAHLDNGADHICIQPLKPDGSQGYDARILEALAATG